jgi:SAM-dependent methyltransferase
MDGDLTDAPSWERTWRRSAGARGGLGSRLGLAQDHHEGLRPIFAAASRGRSGPLEVLELGCAPGRMIRNMAALAPEHHYSGVDFAPAALEDARRMLAEAGLAPELHASDARVFAAERPYDLVVSFGLIEHFEEPLEMIRHHARLVRTGGVVGITVPNFRHPALARALAVYSPRTLDTHNLGVMAPDALRDLLARAGLVEIETGSYGRAVMPVSEVSRSPVGRGIRAVAAAWNLAFLALPRRLSPWQGFFWAHGRRVKA